MNAEVESVLHVALALPAQSRAVVADRLLESLDQPDRAAVATAWAEQAEERLADYRVARSPLFRPTRFSVRSVVPPNHEDLVS